MEWKEFQISEIATLINGRAYSQDELFEKGKYKIVRVGNLSGGNKWFFSDMELDADKYCYPNDLLFSWACNFGPHIWKNDKTIYHYHIWKVKEDSSKIDKYFLYYFLKYRTPYWLGNVNGSVMVHITKGTMEKQSIRIPVNLSDQKKIAGILSALDSKIENNNKINANLEAQAEALFKSWFVDFTPFKDQPFVDSELGPIPQGWKVGKLGDLGEIVGGSTPSKSKPEYYTTHGIAWLTPKDLSTSKAKFTSRGEIDITDEGYKSTSTKLMPRGSVLFSSRAPIGYLTIAKNEICTNQGFKSLVPNGVGTGFVYYTLRHLTSQIENRATGSTFKEASATLMRSVETIVPPTSILNKFEELLRPILQFQEKKEEENQRLAALRDTLLPKLMSGEIKL